MFREGEWCFFVRGIEIGLARASFSRALTHQEFAPILGWFCDRSTDSRLTTFISVSGIIVIEIGFANVCHADDLR